LALSRTTDWLKELRTQRRVKEAIFALPLPCVIALAFNLVDNVFNLRTNIKTSWTATRIHISVAQVHSEWNVSYCKWSNGDDIRSVFNQPVRVHVERHYRASTEGCG
jgi:hypothetical protein